MRYWIFTSFVSPHLKLSLKVGLIIIFYYCIRSHFCLKSEGFRRIIFQLEVLHFASPTVTDNRQCSMPAATKVRVFKIKRDSE